MNSFLIPQLEKSREAVDAANIRAAYANIMSDALTGDLPTDMSTYDVNPVQKEPGWTTTFDFPENLDGGNKQIVEGTPVTFTYDDGKVTMSVSK